MSLSISSSKLRALSPLTTMVRDRMRESPLRTKKIETDENLLLMRQKQRQQQEVEANMRRDTRLQQIQETKEQQKELRAQLIEEQVQKRQLQMQQKQQELAKAAEIRKLTIAQKDREREQMRSQRLEKLQSKTVQQMTDMDDRITRMRLEQKQQQFSKAQYIERKLDSTREQFQINGEMKAEIFEARTENQKIFEEEQRLIREKQRRKEAEELELQRQQMEKKLEHQKENFQMLKNTQKQVINKQIEQANQQYGRYIGDMEDYWLAKNQLVEQRTVQSQGYIAQRHQALQQRVQRKHEDEALTLSQNRAIRQQEQQQVADYFHTCFNQGRQLAQLSKQQKADIAENRHKVMIEHNQKMTTFVDKKNRQENEIKYQLQKFKSDRDNKLFNEMFGTKCNVQMRGWNQIEQPQEFEDREALKQTVFH